MNLDALRSLQKQASSGPWRVVEAYPEPGVQVRYEVIGDDDATLAVSGYLKANAKLAALATHLLPLAEALEVPPCTAGGFCGKQPGGACPSCHTRRRALNALYKALQEALE